MVRLGGICWPQCKELEEAERLLCWQRSVVMKQKLRQREENSFGFLQRWIQYGSGTKWRWRMRRRVKVKVSIKFIATGPGGWWTHLWNQGSLQERFENKRIGSGFMLLLQRRARRLNRIAKGCSMKSGGWRGLRIGLYGNLST